MDLDSLVTTLLTNRGLTSSADISEFFHPTPPAEIPLSRVGLSEHQVSQAIQLIKHHIDSGHPIAVYGDYDVDGICATAIIWETLHSGYPHVFPHIPHRQEEGYGLSRAGIDHCLRQGARLIITVDNGIVANSEVAYAKAAGVSVIVIDHHAPSQPPPPADVLLHSTATSAAGLAWFFSREYSGSAPTEQLSLAALSVVCDIIPLLGINRSLVSAGLRELKSTTRPGLLALYDLARIQPSSLEAYHLGFVIGPRLNAMGRLEHALDSLRLICTTDPLRARSLAETLNSTNLTRQQLTESSTRLALEQISLRYGQSLPKLLIVADPSFPQGIIGLIAAQLVEKFYRPAVAISVGPQESKASARSVAGFHITDHLRTSSDLFTAVGGHSMAAGFTLPTAHLDLLIDQLVTAANSNLSDDLLIRPSRFDAQIPLDLVSLSLYERIREFAPFGLGNPQPTFYTPAVSLTSPRSVGKTGQHLKFRADSLSAIWFNAPPDLTASQLDFIYTVGLDTYTQPPALQLIIKSSPGYVRSSS